MTVNDISEERTKREPWPISDTDINEEICQNRSQISIL